MKTTLIAVLIALPTLCFSNDVTVSAEQAATLVRQPGVEKCLAVVEKNQRGLAQFESIVELGTTKDDSSSTTTYGLTGYNVAGDIIVGSWEIIVVERSAEEGRYSECKITKNEEY